jgi:hypothetical protein
MDSHFHDIFTRMYIMELEHWTVFKFIYVPLTLVQNFFFPEL